MDSDSVVYVDTSATAASGGTFLFSTPLGKSGQDTQEFLDIAAEADIDPDYQEYPLADANRALLDMKERRIRGAKVLRISED